MENAGGLARRGRSTPEAVAGMPGHGPEQSGRSFRSTSACWEVGWSGRIRPFMDVTDSWLLKVSSLHLSCSSLCCPHRVPLHAHAHTYSWHPSAKQAARARANSARRLQLTDVAVSCAHRQQNVRSRMCGRIDLIEPDQVLNELVDDRQAGQAQRHHFRPQKKHSKV